jgi:glycosyltransferase involved in cell wall biosynthesis
MGTKMTFFLWIGLIICAIPFLSEARQKICLNMVVRNDGATLADCLDSVRHLIDYWVIVDLGSNDQTQRVIMEHLKAIPGELYKRHFVNESYNRTEAFGYAFGKGDYLLLMDGNEKLVFHEESILPLLSKDAYFLMREDLPRLIRGNLEWKWSGSEKISMESAISHTSEFLRTIQSTRLGDLPGSSRVSEKWGVWEKQKICLNMMVKNDRNVIRRCLNSVRSFIDYWVIVDLGSTDGTQQLIQDSLKDIPGELHQRSWTNFAESRTEAFHLAKEKGDYILSMEADDVFEVYPNERMPYLTEDFYFIWWGFSTPKYLQPQLLKGNLAWRWSGRLLESLECDHVPTQSILDMGYFKALSVGGEEPHRDKYLRRAQLLQLELQTKMDPTQFSYSAFCLAENCRAAGLKRAALEWYQKCLKMGGCVSEILWSKLMIGVVQSQLEMPQELILSSYQKAHDFQPQRAEPVFFMAKLYNELQEYQKAYDCLKTYLEMPVVVEADPYIQMDWIKEYGLSFELSICTFFLGKYQECYETCEKILSIKALPGDLESGTQLRRNACLGKMSSCD